jgi:iron complex outermembrane receptor protein
MSSGCGNKARLQKMPAKQGQPLNLLLSIVTGSLLLPCTPSSAAADTDYFDLSPEQLFNAKVTSVSKSSQTLLDAPAAVFVLTGEDIMRSGATSIPEALRLVPGVQVARVNANSWAISVRGFNNGLANKLLVLIDGRTVYDPLYSGVYWDIQDTVLEDIDRIEVIRGPGAALWGANAVDGVINIITKQAKDTQGTLASGIAGNQDNMGEGRYGGKLGDNGYYRVYGKYLNRDDEDTLKNGDAHDAETEGRGGFRADWKNNDESKDDYTLQGDVYNNGESQYRNTSFFTAPFTRLALEDVTAHGGNILGRWNRTLSEDSKFTLQSYVDYTDRDQLLLSDQRTTFDIDAQYEFPQMDWNKFIVGGGYRYSADTLNLSPLVTARDSGATTNLFNSFIQDKITLVPKTWFLTLGSKFEHNNYSGFELEPDARLQWQPDDHQMVWAAVSKSVRTPSRLERDLTITQLTGGFDFTFDTIGSPSFQSEKEISYELGYRNQLTPKLSVDVATFYNDYRKLSSLTLTSFDLSLPPPIFLNYTYTNYISAQSYGVETTANWRALDNLNLSVSHSLLVMDLQDPDPAAAPGSTAAEKQSPKYQANARASWDISKDVSYDTTVYYTSALSNFQVQSHTRLDMRLGWRITDRLQFDLVAQDMLDDSHQEFTATSPNPGVIPIDIDRAFYGKLTWRY